MVFGRTTPGLDSSVTPSMQTNALDMIGYMHEKVLRRLCSGYVYATFQQ